MPDVDLGALLGADVALDIEELQHYADHAGDETQGLRRVLATLTRLAPLMPLLEVVEQLEADNPPWDFAIRAYGTEIEASYEIVSHARSFTPPAVSRPTLTDAILALRDALREAR